MRKYTLHLILLLTYTALWAAKPEEKTLDYLCAEYAQYGDDFFEKLVLCIKQGANPNVSASENNSPWFTPLGLALQGNREKNINLLAPLTNKSIRNQLLTTKHPFSWYEPTEESKNIIKQSLFESKVS